MAYGSCLQKLNPVTDKTIADLLQALPFEPSRILDVGCGRGERLSFLSRLFSSSKLSGIDADPEMIAIAQDNSGCTESICFSCQDGASLDYPDCFFDVVLCECTFSLLDNPDSCLMECCRVLRNRGVLILSDLYIESSDARIILPDSSLCKYLYSKAEAERLFLTYFRINDFQDCTHDLHQMAAQAYMDGQFDSTEQGLYAFLRKVKVRYGLWTLYKGL